MLRQPGRIHPEIGIMPVISAFGLSAAFLVDFITFKIGAEVSQVYCST